MLVYLNREFLPAEEARVSVMDRGFLFADGVYEVIRFYGGRLCFLEGHLERLRSGLSALRIPLENVGELAGTCERLIDENGLRDADGAVYIQATRGAPEKRTHSFPHDDVAPTVFVSAYESPEPPAGHFRDGVAAITVPDNRWARCDIKSVALLPNVLANQRAHESDAFEALFVRDGVVLEGSHSNLFAVMDGRLITYPACNYILAGITRAVLIQLARELDIPVGEAPIYLERLHEAEELFLSGTTTEVMPVTSVDGSSIASGAPGDISRRLQAAYRARTGR